jgi:hypothetical protein
MRKIILFGILGAILVPSLSFASIDSNLRYGSRGQKVTELQEFLIDKGFLQGTATGNFYSLTLKAVKAFQSANNISPTGYVGLLTRTEINNELSVETARSISQQLSETGTTTAIVATTSPIVTQLQKQNQLLQQQLSQLQTQTQQTQSIQNSLNQVVQNTTRVITPVVQPVQGSVSIQADPNFNPSVIVGGSTNTTIAKFNLTSSSGANVSLSPVEVMIDGNLASINNVVAYANGVQCGGAVFQKSSALNLNCSLNVPLGQTTVLDIRADIKNGGINYTSGNIQTIITTGDNNGGFSNSSQTVSVPTSQLSGPSIPIGVASVTLTKNPSFSDQNILSNTSNTKIGSFVIQTNSAESVRVTTLTVGLNNTADISNLYLVPVGLTNTNSISPQSSNNFVVNFTIPQSGSQTIDIYGDVSSATGTISTNLTVSGYGVDSNTTVKSSIANGQTITTIQN